MKTNEKYFSRVLGLWDWKVHFQLVSLKELMVSSIRWDHKFRVLGMVLSQIFFGPFSMKSKVEMGSSTDQIFHHLLITKWGITFYRSDKRIFLDSNGSELTLEGQEYFWPCLGKPEAFQNYKASVNDNCTSAKYEWPLFGARVLCETLLGSDQGVIQLDAGWLRCSFRLTEISMQELKIRS